MSEGEKKHGDRGRPQRDKIPRTTQVKRLHRTEKTGKPLKTWAKDAAAPIVQAWLAAK